MSVIVRAITYAVVFAGVVLVYLPARLLGWSGLVRPASLGPFQILGMVVGAIGFAVAVWCILAFAFVGKGTPAPFDAPRRLVVRGPYRFVRNPMYIGAGLVLAGAALFYRSLLLLGYAAVLLLIAHLFVMWYEEPALRRAFGKDYEAYCHRVRRWLPSPGTPRGPEAD